MLIHIDLPQSDRSTIDQPSPRGPKNCGSEGHFAAQKFGTLIQSHCLYLLICWIIKFYPLKLPVENMRTSNLTHQNCQWKSSRSGLANSNCHAFQNIIFYQLKSSKILEQVQPIKIAMKFWNIKFYPSHSWNSLTSILPIEIAIKKMRHKIAPILIAMKIHEIFEHPNTSLRYLILCQKQLAIHPSHSLPIPSLLSHVHRLWAAHRGWRTNCWSDGWPPASPGARCCPRGAASTDSMDAPPGGFWGRPGGQGRRLSRNQGNADEKWPLGWFGW